MNTCDILLVGVGGQGVLTIGDLLVRAAFATDVPASFCPTKGMAQRGGFVKVEVRLGAEGVGPRIGEHCADIVLAMFLLSREFSLEQKKRNFDYYDPLTTGDSSLSASVQNQLYSVPRRLFTTESQ